MSQTMVYNVSIIDVTSSKFMKPTFINLCKGKNIINPSSVCNRGIPNMQNIFGALSFKGQM